MDEKAYIADKNMHALYQRVELYQVFVRSKRNLNPQHRFAIHTGAHTIVKGEARCQVDFKVNIIHSHIHFKLFRTYFTLESANKNLHILLYLTTQPTCIANLEATDMGPTIFRVKVATILSEVVVVVVVVVDMQHSPQNEK
uniref:Uncharacterized protein n=1 Tax=Glossina pallidipes TaxID=7398 RepID=A0A1A9ZEM0_GLOPL